MSTFRNIFLSLVFLTSLLPFTACALSEVAIEGKVLEEGTGKPVSGAIVVARWSGTAFSFVESPTVCVHVLTTMTDAEGRYRFPAWRKEPPLRGVRDVHPIVIAYKPGYETYTPLGHARSEEYKKNIRYLKPFTGTGEERLAYLSRMAVSCSDKKEIEIDLLPLYKALYEEAENLAVTKKEDKLKVLYRLRDVERLELGSDKAWENFRQRERELQ